MEGYSAIILAAGFSSRMGDFKPLMKVGGKSAVKQLIDTAKEAGIKDVTVVTGHQWEKLEEYLRTFDVKAVHNDQFAEGMFTSIQAGIREVSQHKNHKGCFLMLVDCPLVPKEIFGILAREAEDNFTVPCYKGKKGHPLFIPARYYDEIIAYDGEGGLKGMMKPYDDSLVRIDTDSEGVVADMDTPEGYDYIVSLMEKGEKSIKDVDFNGRVFLIRHGETQQHVEKVFLGQTDVKLSDIGKDQAAKNAFKLAEKNLCIDTIYSGALSRAKDTAQIVKEYLKTEGKDAKLITEEEFNEINLGDWDGKYIREIKEKFPEEYKKRGDDILKYKIGNEGENYYDLQYRVMKKFISVLEDISRQDKSKGERHSDVLLISHSGVIKVIISNMFDMPLEKVLKLNIPKGALVEIKKKKDGAWDLSIE